MYAKFYDTTLGEYIVISTVDQLMAIKDNPAAKYLLACDINCKGNVLVPVDEFSGKLEGNGYKIHNFRINEQASVIGFVRTNNGIIRNTTFSNFVFTAEKNDGTHKNYGIVCAVNNGTIDNCLVTDGEMKIGCNKGTPDPQLYIGAIAGTNFGTITGCQNYISIKADTQTSGAWNDQGHIYSHIGGIVGHNEKDAAVSNCANYGKLNISVTTNHYGRSYFHLGGITGENLGKIETSVNQGDIVFNGTEDLGGDAIGTVLVGGAIGYNTGNVMNCYSQEDIIIKNVGNDNGDYVGGFVGHNYGSIYNCFTTSNIEYGAPNARAIGGFAGFNEAFTIDKCFSTGSIKLADAPANIGCFIGQSTGAEKDCYYLDTMTISKVVGVDELETIVAVDPTNDIGQAKAESGLLSVDFLENTMYFDRMVWLLIDGELPALR